MKITKRQLGRIIKEEKRKLLKEEGADCIKDYIAMGYSRAEAYKECDAYDEEDSGGGYSHTNRYSSKPRKTSYVGSDANADQITAIETALSAKPNNFLQSVLGQLKKGRGLSGKQKSIVKSIIAKTAPESASLFEAKDNKMKITKRQLKRIIKEEKAQLLREAPNFRDPETGENLWLVLNDVVGKLLDGGVAPVEMANELRGLADDVEDSAPIQDAMEHEMRRNER